MTNASEREIKAGDLVMLKSGGPTMSVDWIEDKYGTLTASCTWFDGKKRMSEQFTAAVLKPVSPMAAQRAS